MPIPSKSETTLTMDMRRILADVQPAKQHGPMTLKFYQDRQREWRWTLIARNGKKVACSGEGYRHRRDCVQMAYKILKGY